MGGSSGKNKYYAPMPGPGPHGDGGQLPPGYHPMCLPSNPYVQGPPPPPPKPAGAYPYPASGAGPAPYAASHAAPHPSSPTAPHSASPAAPYPAAPTAPQPVPPSAVPSQYGSQSSQSSSPTVYDTRNNIIWVPDALAATALDGQDGKYDMKYNGAKIKIMKKKNGKLIYPGNPASYGYPDKEKKNDPYKIAGVGPGGSAYSPQKDVIYVPDSYAATKLDAADGTIDGKYYDTPIVIKKAKDPAFYANKNGNASPTAGPSPTHPASAAPSAVRASTPYGQGGSAHSAPHTSGSGYSAPYTSSSAHAAPQTSSSHYGGATYHGDSGYGRTSRYASYGGTSSSNHYDTYHSSGGTSGSSQHGGSKQYSGYGEGYRKLTTSQQYIRPLAPSILDPPAPSYSNVCSQPYTGFTTSTEGLGGHVGFTLPAGTTTGTTGVVDGFGGLANFSAFPTSTMPSDLNTFGTFGVVGLPAAFPGVAAPASFDFSGVQPYTGAFLGGADAAAGDTAHEVPNDAAPNGTGSVHVSNAGAGSVHVRSGSPGAASDGTYNGPNANLGGPSHSAGSASRNRDLSASASPRIRHVPISEQFQSTPSHNPGSTYSTGSASQPTVSAYENLKTDYGH